MNRKRDHKSVKKAIDQRERKNQCMTQELKQELSINQEVTRKLTREMKKTLRGIFVDYLLDSDLSAVTTKIGATFR